MWRGIFILEEAAPHTADMRTPPTIVAALIESA